MESAEDIKEYILNISSYYAEATITVNSNKNTNKYVIKQSYLSPNVFKQEILEPSSIQGLVTTYDGSNLKIENNQIGLSKMYENYPYICENSLDLYSFIKDCKESGNIKLEENENEVIMEVKSDKQENKIIKKLYITKNSLKPTKLEVQDRNEKILVYILYNEIKMNSETKDDILAFKLNEENMDI